jgi:hypothetical protein
MSAIAPLFYVEGVADNVVTINVLSSIFWEHYAYWLDLIPDMQGQALQHLE